MQALTLEVIQRVVFGSRDPELRDALRAALDLTQSTPNLIAMSLVQRDLGPRSPFGRFLRPVERIDGLLEERIDRAGVRRRSWRRSRSPARAGRSCATSS